MPTYLISNRPPEGYSPSAGAAAAWSAWFEALGEHLVERGNPVFAVRTMGESAGGTRLGGYTLVVADDLDAAVALAARCPVLEHGGGVEVGELTTVNAGPARACSYEIHLQCTAEQVWDALTDPDRSAVWWAHHNVSDWRAGSRWEHRRADGSGIADIAGTVLESRAPSRLALTWANPQDASPVAGAAIPPDGSRRGPSRVTFDLEPHRALVRLTVTHENLASSAEHAALTAGWAAVLSNLKTYLETGQPLPVPPWEALDGFVRTY